MGAQRATTVPYVQFDLTDLILIDPYLSWDGDNECDNDMYFHVILLLIRLIRFGA